MKIHFPFKVGFVGLVLSAFAVAGPRGYCGEDRDQTLSADTHAKVRLTQAEQDWVKAHPHVRWGADPNWPPFSSFDRQGKLVGIDADITRLVAERVGLKLTFVQTASWSEVFEKAKAGEVEFLSATARSPERLELFNYSDDYGQFPVVVITRDTSPFILSLDLKSITAAQPRDHAITSRLQADYPMVRFVLTDTSEDALRLVARGKANATVVNLAVATRIVRLNGLTNLKISGVTRYTFPLHFAVRKDAPELLAILNKGLATLTPREEENIYAAHLTPDIGKARDWSVWRRRALYSLLIGVPLAGALIFWNRGLASQIRRRKAAEADLREARDRVQQHAHALDLRVKEVERLNLDLKSANEDLEAFSGSASHDLRAPLRRVHAFTELISETENQLTPDSRQWLANISDQTRRMDDLIRDLLHFARLGRAELHTDSVDLTRVVNAVVEDFRPQYSDRDVRWSVGELGRVSGDAGLLRLAVSNLIDNALKYSRRTPQTCIKIDVRPEQDGEEEKVFYIQDNGCGFDPASAGALFTPFKRLHHGKDYEGTGIGLANVKKIIQKHHGRIWFESQVGQGATFFFSLPIAPPLPTPAPASRERVQTSSPEPQLETLHHH
jgi:signal transduction histidine kinase